MPLFSRSSFRTPKKPPRRNKSLPNISQLDDSLNFTTDSVQLGAGDSTQQLTMKLGACELVFEDGQWLLGGGDSSGKVGAGSRDYARLKKHSQRVSEENNLLKYKVDLLLDMLAASNADCLVMQRELEALKKAQIQTQNKR